MQQQILIIVTLVFLACAFVVRWVGRDIPATVDDAALEEVTEAAIVVAGGHPKASELLATVIGVNPNVVWDLMRLNVRGAKVLDVYAQNNRDLNRFVEHLHDAADKKL